MALTINNPTLEQSLAERARAEGISAEAYVERILARDLMS